MTIPNRYFLATYSINFSFDMVNKVKREHFFNFNSLISFKYLNKMKF